ncbi:hypothetical protein [Mesorhizobium sangaii]|uniref:Uncharacterized protein n=1 Tax=Mesorhizobium sangaii TaxID=505389 RepID=A0A841P2H6_9HYPH|nr:hypothetical protein [Mesorhizobium sangaii]MBB6409366.1 hypothetical protein [Mesorhizobium sangaii]
MLKASNNREMARQAARALHNGMTDKEDAAITAAALADPDAQPLPDYLPRKPKTSAGERHTDGDSDADR